MNHIPYEDTHQFSSLVIDYLKSDEKLKPFINYFPSFDNFEKQIREKNKQNIDREVLVEVLKKQNINIKLSKTSKTNIDSLLSKKTFTVSTGHQTCLFTGPLYFFYKIISTLNLTEQLSAKFPNNHFVPIFWMATEDHDFEEVNKINLFGKEVIWDNSQSGAVGRMKLDRFKSVFDELSVIIGDSKRSKELLDIFRKTYLEHAILSDATRYLINELFGKYGLVILDPDEKKLKQQIIPIIKRDILDNAFAETIRSSSNKLGDNYKIQAYVRDINFFTLSQGKRELIKKVVSKKNIETNPDIFSPNVLLRPLYQETILPNIATVGGGSELAYWMQLKTAFQQENIPFPILLLRNSVLIISTKQKNKIVDLGFAVEDVFKHEHLLQKEFVSFKEPYYLSLKKEKEVLNQLFIDLTQKTDDVGLQNSIKAQLQKQLKFLDKIEQRFIRNNKKQYQNSLKQISKLKNTLFPNNVLQERVINFIPFYLIYGDNFIEILKQNLNPLKSNFVVLEF